MRVLHTADWHLGQNLMFKDRRREHAQFLDWLVQTVERQKIDVVLIAGDVFDNGTPPNYALELYYTFLVKVAATCCRTVIITGGNHDSVATLHAPKAVLSALNIHVIGGITSHIDDEIIRITKDDGKVMGLVCAVPFLRDRDIRRSVPGESYEEKSRALLDGVRMHYSQVRNRALEILDNLRGHQKNAPLIAMGHLSVAGGLTSDGVREIYVGSSGEIESDDFPDEFNYVALGHLHYPQTVNGCEHIRYSGSPIALSFGEADTPKQVVVVETKTRQNPAKISFVDIPRFQALRVVEGKLEELEQKLRDILPDSLLETVWVEVKVDAEPSDRTVESKVKAMIEGLPIELFAVKRIRKADRSAFTRKDAGENLQDMAVDEVFEKRLSHEEELEEDDKAWLRQAFTEIVETVKRGEGVSL